MTVRSCGICNVQLAACAVRFVESCERRHQTDFEIALSLLLCNDVLRIYVWFVLRLVDMIDVISRMKVIFFDNRITWFV